MGQSMTIKLDEEGRMKDVFAGNTQQSADPHAELRKTWKPGQRWQERTTRFPERKNWCTWAELEGEPNWWNDWEYRREPDDKDAEDASKPVESMTYPGAWTERDPK